ncbi:MAG: DsbA family protein [Alphaproteobacteria bacterium]|nr:DsbA family protein [Alphaproteobacteria bacterium]MBU0792439.1 DsbA family protein [Alphaproteobacteria bacterium]MBU0876833.1 DsbA family protein [Alphaproteobacteria bacterium]MBU1769803.1 DsbA family protein [Alphaproteobacteria bacterium]
MNRRFATAPLALAALMALAACGSQEGNSSAPIGQVEGKAAPAGTTWAERVVVTPEGGMLMGNPDAPIKIVEFASNTCSHCAQFAADSHEALERDYVNSGKVSFEFRNFVMNPIDISVALLARCSGPEAFFPLTHQFFANQAQMIQQVQSAGDGAYQSAMSAPPEQRFQRIAEMAGLIEFAMQRGVPEDKARQCLADTKTVEALAAGVERDTAQYNITGTPTLIMNGTKLDNVTTWPQLQEQLKNAGA